MTHPTTNPEPAPAGPGTADLAALAASITAQLREHFPREGEQTRQVLALAEEAGEVVGAYRRWTGRARRTGTFQELAAELADVVITAYVTAHALNVSLPQPADRGELIDHHIDSYAPGDGDAQVMNLFAVTGQFVQAHLYGHADEAELTDIVTAAYATAHTLNIDLPDAIAAKTRVLFTRPWRDHNP